jgi:integrase
MASIRRHHSGAFQVRYAVIVDGKRTQRHRSFASRAEARAFANDVERLYERRGLAPVHVLTVAQMVERFLAAKAPQLQPTTHHNYRGKLAYLVREIGAMRLDRVTPKQLNQTFETLLASGGRDGRPLESITVRHIRRAASSMFKLAQSEGAIASNPVTLTEPIHVPFRKARAHSTLEAATIIAAAGPAPWPQFLYLLTATGLRRSEGLGLRWRDLDLDGQWLTVAQVAWQAGRASGLREMGKSKSAMRTIGIDTDLCGELRAWRAMLAQQALALGIGWHADALVFPNISSGSLTLPYRPDYVTGRMRNLARRIGLPRGISPIHGLRHRHASSLMALPTVLVSERLGHSTPTITRALYQHGDQETARATSDAAAAAFSHLRQFIPAAVSTGKTK